MGSLSWVASGINSPFFRARVLRRMHQLFVVVVVVVVVLTLTRIIKSVVTGQAPVSLELRNTRGKTHY